MTIEYYSHHDSHLIPSIVMVAINNESNKAWYDIHQKQFYPLLRLTNHYDSHIIRYHFCYILLEYLLSLGIPFGGVKNISRKCEKTRYHSCRETNDVSTIVFIIMILISTPQNSVHLNLIAGHHIHIDSKRKQWRRTSSCAELPTMGNRSR